MTNFWGILGLWIGVLAIGQSTLAEAASPEPTPTQEQKQKDKKRTPQQVLDSSVWIAKSDGSLSCEPNSGIALGKAAQELNAAKIPFSESQKGSQGLVHAQMCGAEEGSMNYFLIPSKYLEKALKMGYLKKIPSP